MNLFATKTKNIPAVTCYHCGNECIENCIDTDEKSFCCEGCKTVFEILSENNLCNYYSLNNQPGISTETNITGQRFAFLDDEKIKQQLILFSDGKSSQINFHIPAMHCSSCIWLLENLRRINDGVLESRVDFIKKELFVVFDESKTSLRKLVEQLTVVGYEPSLHLDSLEKEKKKKSNNARIYRLGVAGFCLGNIMLFSFPEYFSGGNYDEHYMRMLFGYANLFLAIPVIFYCASEFFKNSFKSFAQKSVGIDVAISLGITAMFVRSAYEILSHTGAGYMDSMAGLVFFTLAGRWFQDKTFESISFERNYKSYFPIAVTVIKNKIENIIPVNELKVTEIIQLRNNEIIPADGILIQGNGFIDYSFVTGESLPIEKHVGEMIFAGGRQIGTTIQIQVMKDVNHSYLTQLWNKQSKNLELNFFQKLSHSFSRWFIIVTILIAVASFLYWFRTDMSRAINAFTSVLIIACPCAFSLSAPFAFGNMLRLLGKKKIYLKSTDVLHKLADINTIVFDKTGTLTENKSSQIFFEGVPLTKNEEEAVYSLLKQSAHPLSQSVSKKLSNNQYSEVIQFSEETGKGVFGIVNGYSIKAGSAVFTGANQDETLSSKVFININGEIKGYFNISNSYRDGLVELLLKLRKKFSLSVISGDTGSEEKNLRNFFGEKAKLLFKQMPEDKLNFIRELQSNKNKVMMIGDGLNDSGALMQSDAAITITDNENNFSPSSDCIVHASQFTNLHSLIKFSRAGLKIVLTSFILSLIYNFIGLWFACSGTLSPIIAAILMPISTVSLVLFAVALTTLFFKKLFK